MSASLKAAQIIRCINAGISCLASTFIMFMILTEPEKGLASPYSRIIFAMSISDILFSCGLFFSPFMSPKDNPDALFAIGTTGSCEAIGFIFILGYISIMFFTVFLTYYFMRRIKYKVTPQNFAKKEENYFRVVLCFIALFMAISNLATGSINSQAYGSLCVPQPYPEGCDKSPEMTCERGDGKLTKIWNVFGIFFGVSSFIGLIVILALTVHHVYKEERTFTLPAREIGNTNRCRIGNADRNDLQRQEGIECATQNQMLLTKQALHQSLLYILAFCVVYLPILIANIQKKFFNEIKEPEWRFWFISLLSPLGGVFNILIYTRPKVMKMKESYPNTHVFRIFLVIVLTGGEIPSIADLRVKQSDENDQQNNDRFNEEEGNSQDFFDDMLSYDLDISDASNALDEFNNSSSFSWFSMIFGHLSYESNE
ncbi:hypothetical protein CTEN210_06627 [Chaetoceros tenuissimus]|uniref:G-protein coupled receptors family 1 profile domain-containing protein n=1 Tax=Chaetoceros tenuissimus TaxID=426638 RepID=A0AAD3CS16_9STRA|nr:hypothetical protein CTEN210_06627 [Chaetoceros tenuissimus]